MIRPKRPTPLGWACLFWPNETIALLQTSAVHRALAQQDTERVLYEVFVRLYTLRNQLMHGGATWNSSVNRMQVRDGRALLSCVLPVMLGVMMQNPARFEGKPFYPVVLD